MANTTITLTVFSNGLLVDPASVVLEDSANTFGVKRIDTGGIVVAAGVAMAKTSTGIYAHTFPDPVPSLTYEYEYKVIFTGTTHYRNKLALAGTIADTLILPDSSTYYSSQSEVYNVLGTVAAGLMEDDFSSGDKHLIWNEALQSVTETIDLYIHQFYKRSVLLTSNWVRRKATVLAANWLSNRRGNPQLFLDQVDRIYGELDQIRSGRLTLPGIAERGYFGPMVRNYELETFRRFHPLRVESTVSMMGDPYDGQDISWEYPFWF